MDIDFGSWGQTAGAATASFLATWAALVRPLHQKVKRQGVPTEDIEAIRRGQDELRTKQASQNEQLVKLSAQLEEYQRTQLRLEKALEKTQEMLAKTVTDDEFATYTASMNANVQTLVEKLGNATGAIEAWYRSQPGGR